MWPEGEATRCRLFRPLLECERTTSDGGDLVPPRCLSNASRSHPMWSAAAPKARGMPGLGFRLVG